MPDHGEFEKVLLDRAKGAGGAARIFFDIWRREAPMPAMIRHVLDQGPRFVGAKLCTIHLSEDSGTGGRLTATLALSEGVGVVVAMALDRDGFCLTESGGEDPVRVGAPHLWPDKVHPAIARFLDHAVHEARLHHAAAAVAMVHSFDPNDGGLKDFETAAAALDIGGVGPAKLAGPAHVAGIELFLGWCADRPGSEEFTIVNGRKTDCVFFDEDD